jgi:hypothetical protein
MKRFMVLFVLLLFQPLVLAQYAHPDYASGKKAVGSVSLIVLARVSEFGLMSNDGKLKSRETVQASDFVAGLTTKLLRDAGFVVDYAEDVRDKPTRAAFNKLISQYINRAPFPFARPEDVRSGSVTIGMPAAILPTNPDALVFVRCVNQVTTGGRKFGSFQPDLLMLDIALVDPSSGTVLYYAKADDHENLMKDQHKLHAMLDKAFASLPKARHEPKLAAEVKVEDPNQPAATPAKPHTVEDAETIRFTLDPSDSTQWNEGHAEVIATESIHEFVPKGEHVENWTRMYDWQAFARTDDPELTPMLFVNNLRQNTTRRCPHAKWNIIEQSTDSVMYEFRTGRCSPNPEQHELGRIFSGSVNQYRIAYVRKTKELSADERERWLKVLREATVVAGSK